MESTDSSNQAGVPPKKERILLNVLSPSPEVPQKLTYAELPVSTTISELKQKIQNDVETRPSAERQRLIYRGRPLLQGERSLENVFGVEEVLVLYPCHAWRMLIYGSRLIGPMFSTYTLYCRLYQAIPHSITHIPGRAITCSHPPHLNNRPTSTSVRRRL